MQLDVMRTIDPQTRIRLALCESSAFRAITSKTTMTPTRMRFAATVAMPESAEKCRL